MAIAVNQKHGTTNVLEVVVAGKLSHRDYETLSPEVEDMVKHFGKIRVSSDMVEFHGWEMGALWDDTKFACHHYVDISHIAMVGDKAWERVMASLCKQFTKAEIRYFDRSDMAQARRWIDAPNKETLEHALATSS